VISLLLVVAAIADPQGFSALRGAALDLTSPCQVRPKRVNAVTAGPIPSAVISTPPSKC
jgi:hypothetical protein